MYSGLYESGKRFSLAGLYAQRNGLGDATAIDWNTLLAQGLNDVTQLFSPGTPSPIPVYTPTSTVFARPSAFSLNNPLVLAGLAVGAVLLLRKR